MKKYKAFVKLAFLVTAPAFLFLELTKPSLPEKNEISSHVLNGVPVQKPTGQKEFELKLDSFVYKIIPRYEYEISGLIVSSYDSENIFDVTHEMDPGNIKDLCVVWGKNIENGGYKQVKYKSGEFTCFYSWRGRSPDFDGKYLANNHLIPANDDIKRKIKSASIGDQVKIKGLLADYEVYGPNEDLIFMRGTSTKRDDTGNGACEIIYVNDFEIISDRGYYRDYIKKVSKIGAATSFLLIVVNFFAL